MALLSDSERAEHERSVRPDARRRFAVTRALVRAALSERGSLRPQEWEFVAGEHGRPRIVDRDVPCPLHFSVSHSGDLVACAVSDTFDLGIDVECIDREVRMAGIAARCFAESERAEWEPLAAIDKRRRFFELWTLKEAYLKARGLGLSVSPRRVALRVRSPEDIELTIDPELGDVATGWTLSLEWPEPRYVLALAVRGRTGDRAELRMMNGLPRVMSSASG